MNKIIEDFYKPVMVAIMDKMGINNGSAILANKEASDFICEWIELNVPSGNIIARERRDLKILSEKYAHLDTNERFSTIRSEMKSRSEYLKNE